MELLFLGVLLLTSSNSIFELLSSSDSISQSPPSSDSSSESLFLLLESESDVRRMLIET
jgi:hypothetical protein